MTVTRMVLSFGPQRRRRRREGDRKMIRGVEHICQQSMASGCYLVNHGRPVLEWVPVSVARVTRELAAIRATQTSSSSSPSM